MSAILAGFAVAELVLRNATVHTMDPARPSAREVAVSAGRIVAVGADVGAWVGPGTRVVDLKGQTVVPGLIDAHGHLRGLGESLETVNLRDAASAGAAANLVAEAAKSRKPGEWIVGRGWDQTRWPGAEFPTTEPLDRAAPSNPVYLTRVDGHAAWVNRRALEMADVNSATRDPEGGRIHRDASGRPSGVLVDRAMAAVRSRIPASTRDQVFARQRLAVRECARLGLTGVHDAGSDRDDVAAWDDMAGRGDLPIRVYAMIRGGDDLMRSYFRAGPRIGDWVTVRAIKLMADGALGSRGASLKEPYSDEPGNRGLVVTDRRTVERIAREAAAAGFQVNTHAIGDRANRDVLDAYAAVLGGPNDRRFRIEHAQVVSLDDIPLFARYSVIASMQATHATSDMRWAEQRVGPLRVLGAYAWRRMLAAGVRVANGSDFPVEDANPLWGFYASVTRQDRQGSPVGGWQPDQAMTRQEALRSWTIDAAHAGFDEKRRGSIETGKLADLVVLSRDIMRVPAREILETRVTMTIVDGRVVYP